MVELHTAAAFELLGGAGYALHAGTVIAADMPLYGKLYIGGIFDFLGLD